MMFVAPLRTVAFLVERLALFFAFFRLGDRLAVFLVIFLLVDFFLVAISVAPRFRVPGFRARVIFLLGTQAEEAADRAMRFRIRTPTRGAPKLAPLRFT
jgi:hypothetical protein